ncbi:TPA: S-methyl-5-thioribose kinase [Klebsiella oxytoca]|uniref:S-methyl-5-thioribose kinase n=1 Tax=Klebsiella oxytoca TaxID=571 RepID=A0AAN5RG15_KLEOX|nr:S-methyl-5-thioribose kinase [Klebsiella oxytoca]
MSGSIPAGYKPLTCDTLPNYLASRLTSACEPGGKPEEWKVSEVGDGNLNMVFIVQGTLKSIIVKQALPWLRAGGKGWPLSLSRAGFEYKVLCLEARFAGHKLIPEVYFYDPEMALFVMEYLTPHVILRKELIAGRKFPKLATDIGTFLARTLFHTSDIGMPAAQKKTLTAEFALNHELCRITEDLIFTEPYYNAERNNWTSPELDADVQKVWCDREMIQVAMRYKYKFMTETQALLHGDLHSGSIMVTDTDTKVIDPEFGFMGPMAFDIGNYTGNLLLAYFSRPGQDSEKQRRIAYQEWLLLQIEETWAVFTREFRQLWNTRTQGEAWPAEIYPRTPVHSAVQQEAQDQFFSTLLEDSLVNAGMEMNRRIIGFAGVTDLKLIENAETRAECERSALAMARELMVNARKFENMASVSQFARTL